MSTVRTVCFVCGHVIGIKEIPVWAERDGMDQVRELGRTCSDCSTIIDTNGVIFIETLVPVGTPKMLTAQHKRYYRATSEMAEYLGTILPNSPFKVNIDKEIGGHVIYVPPPVFEFIIEELNKFTNGES